MSFNGAGRTEVLTAISVKIQTVLREATPRKSVKWAVSYHFYPQDGSGAGRVDCSAVQFRLRKTRPAYFSQKSFAIVKRAIDIAGSLSALVGAFTCIRSDIGTDQNDVGGTCSFFGSSDLKISGVAFTFLKFRSMHVINDSGSLPGVFPESDSGKAIVLQEYI